jgi:hypothetical protein
MGHRFLCALAFVGLVLVLPRTSFAHPMESEPFPTCPSKKGTGDAEAHYNAGREAYDNRKLDRALPEFFEAYAMACEQHDVLLIISRSYELDRNYTDAIRALEVYKERTKDNSPENNALLGKLRETKREEDAKAAQLAEAKAKAAAAANAKPVVKTVEVRGHTLAPWLVVATGAVAVATGAVLALVVYDSPHGGKGTLVVRDSMGNTREEEDPTLCAVESFPSTSSANCYGVKKNGKKMDDSLTFRNVGGWLMIGGAAAVVGGVVWHFLEPTGSETPRARFSPSISPTYAGASWAATF